MSRPFMRIRGPVRASPVWPRDLAWGPAQSSPGPGWLPEERPYSVASAEPLSCRALRGRAPPAQFGVRLIGPTQVAERLGEGCDAGESVRRRRNPLRLLIGLHRSAVVAQLML